MKISIVTPSFNQEEFIERTILSVLTQAGDFELEYLIMDGGSTDQSVKIIQKYDEQLKAGTFPIACKKIDLIRKSEKDRGQSDAINKGLALATGEILSYLNSDDTLAPGALELVANQLGNSEKKWSYGKCLIVGLEDQEIRKFITRYKDLLGKKYRYAKLLTENFISQMTVFWKREVMEELGVFDVDEHLCMDYEYWLRLGEKYDPLTISEHLANFRFYHTSKSGARFTQQFKDELRLARKYARGKYKCSLFLHQINYYKIIIAYKILGFLKK